MSEPITDTTADSTRFRRSLQVSIGFVACLWMVKLGETLLGLDLSGFGVHPGRAPGLVGILSAPFVHGSWSHLASNTPPLVVLGTAVMYGYPRSARIVIPVVSLGAGFCVWLFARETYHIGASGLTFGMMFFVFTIGALRWDKRAIALAMIVFFLYGSMIWGIFPTKPGISFEFHFFGAAIGVLLAFALRNLDPAPPAKRYSWEDDDDDEHWPP